ncbi:hypothetical protein QYE76_061503 [Lolium multiflorum]|uniref:DUF6598 domain-containing protein n=1 Tax=Lolium multiflorum TaxID=4521 RepID=A0AAD8W593_LOLMU|nr:hypothetical protein QYE76_061503 [Lolium multiflorum]
MYGNCVNIILFPGRVAAVISPMHFTHSTPGRGLHDAACFAPTLQIFTLRLAGIKGGLEWPLSVYGVVAARDEVDHNRNLLFSCNRSESQKLDQDLGLPFSSPYRTGAEGEWRADERWVEEWLGRRWSRGGAAAMQGSLGSKREDTREGTRGLRI